jgi:hypothetical protein
LSGQIAVADRGADRLRSPAARASRHIDLTVDRLGELLSEVATSEVEW